MSSNMASTCRGGGAVRRASFDVTAAMVVPERSTGNRLARPTRRYYSRRMRIENEFEVAAPLEQVWNYLLDVEKVAPCVPGGELTEVVDDHTWKGKVTIKMGPVSLTFNGVVTLQERDEEHRRVVLKAEGREQRGKGAANALSTSRLEPVGDRTRVAIETDLTITGAVAQYGRGMIGDISQRLTQQFADCLAANILAEGASTAAAEASPPTPGTTEEVPAPVRKATPMGGIRLGLWAFWRAIVRLFRRLLGGRRA
jgi:uncharacterized protein